MFFIDLAERRAGVLYHRYDGHYGLISPARGIDPISAKVDEMCGGTPANHADIAWNSNSSGSGKGDALTLAKRCVAEWKAFFQQNGLDPAS